MTIIIRSKDKQGPIVGLILNGLGQSIICIQPIYSPELLCQKTVFGDRFLPLHVHVPAIHTPWTVPLIVNGIIDAASYCSYYYAASYCSEAVIPHRNPYAG